MRVSPRASSPFMFARQINPRRSLARIRGGPLKMGPGIRTCLLSILLVVVVFGSSAFANANLAVTNSGAITNGSPVGMWFDYVVVIMLENHGINTTYGSSCMGDCSYFNTLADTNGLAKDYNSGGVSGSLGDYIAITSGKGSVTCNNPPDGSCGPYTDANVVDRIEAKQLSWKGYMEDYPLSCGSSCSPGNCFMGSTSSSGHYVSIHNPLVYYQDIVSNASRCSKITRANSVIPSTQPACGTPSMPGTVENDDLFLKDLNSASSSANYMFLTPNTVDDLHDCGDVSLGNHYLQLLIPQILNSTLFKTTRAALFVTFDEKDPFTGASPFLYTVWASHASTITKFGFKSIQPYDHFTALKTIETNWGFSPLGSTGTGVADMSEFFK